jgi:antitoxin component YwqK of YwqJK toxin-antitoxin module
MKHYTLPFLLFIFLIQSTYSQDTLTVWYDSAWNEIKDEENAVYYRKAFEQNELWVVRDYYINHAIQMEGFFLTKKMKTKHGMFTYYFENGNKSSEGKYEKGKLSGIWSFWNEDGTKKSEGPFLNEKRDGEWSFWNDEGTLSSHEKYKKGIIQSIKGYHINGIIQYEGSYLSGFQHGLWTYYDSFGRITMKGNFSFGMRTGKWTKFFKDGKMDVFYKNGQTDKKYGGIIRNE